CDIPRAFGVGYASGGAVRRSEQPGRSHRHASQVRRFSFTDDNTGRGLAHLLPRPPPPLRSLQGWELNTYDAAGNRTSKTNYLNPVTSNYGCSNSRDTFPPQSRKPQRA